MEKTKKFRLGDRVNTTLELRTFCMTDLIVIYDKGDGYYQVLSVPDQARFIIHSSHLEASNDHS